MKLLMILFFLLYSNLVEANGHISYTHEYNYKIKRVIDGDTLEIEIDFLPKELGNTLKLRVLGVDTPEKGNRSHCVLESFKAENATLFTKMEVEKAKDIKIIIRKWDKYGGRVLGDIRLDGELLSKKLIDKGYAIEYMGKGSKPNWC